MFGFVCLCGASAVAVLKQQIGSRDESLDWTTTVVLKTEAEFLNSISQVWLC